MTGHEKELVRIQSAADRLINARPEEKTDALENLARSILEHYNHSYESIATSNLFSIELPRDIQRFASVWLVRCLTWSPDALGFGDAQRLAASLFDRAFREDVYGHIKIESGIQTFEKLQVLAAHFQKVFAEIDELINVTPDPGQLRAFQGEVMRQFNRKEFRPLLPLVPRSLTNRSRLNNLFQAITDYTDNTDIDPIHRRDFACDVCDEFEMEARAYGTKDADRLLGGLARGLKAAVTSHFDSLEGSKIPRLTLSPIAKKYPLTRPDSTIVFKIRISNDGTGPARDLRLEEVVSNDCLLVQTSSMELGTIQAGDSFVLDIFATIVTPCGETKLLVLLSWSEPGRRIEGTHEFPVVSQREDVDWDSVELKEPYSLEAVKTGDELIGRRAELRRLLRLANNQSVGSGFIYGQKRVGKTSLANAVEESLKSSSDMDWIVINKGSGDYVGDDAISTLRTLGDVLVQAMKQRIPGLADVPSPDFTNGLAPLSGFVDEVLSRNDLRLLFILDEFDELPPDLFGRTDLATALFQPIRQISNKRGCGFLLVGGESMQQIVNTQGDRLNKFTPVELDYFTKSNNWNDFAELIRRPVENWLTINDAALDELFVSSAGNPYFAKLLASQLFSDMVENRYSDASEFDMSAAINKALTSIGANSFAHFWIDGLGSLDNAQEIRIIRRSALIAIGRAFRKHSSANSTAIWAEFQNAAGLPVEEQRFRVTLQDFIRRKVLVEDEQGSITPKIPLFRSWLKDKGVGELLGDSRELDYLKSRLQDEEQTRVHDHEISDLCRRLEQFRFKGRAIVPTTIGRWLDQFNSLEDRRLMFRLLSNVRVYDEQVLRIKMHEAFGMVTRNIRTVIEPGARVRNDILVSPLDDSPAKSGWDYCRLFVSENGISTQSVQTLESLDRRLSGDREFQRLVLIDDFSGTGQTLVDGMKKHLDLLKRVNSEGIEIKLVTLVGFTQARDHVERFIRQNNLVADVRFCDELGPEQQAFSETSAIFPDPAERDRARQVAEEKGVRLETRHPLGYGDTQALVVFHQSCPNNTLPILWSSNNSWLPLFPRT